MSTEDVQMDQDVQGKQDDAQVQPQEELSEEELQNVSGGLIIVVKPAEPFEPN